MSRPVSLIFCAVLALLAGCNAVDSRIRQKEAMFRALDPATQQKLRNKKVEIGYTPDMVYVALGSPTSHSERSTAEGQTMIWIYSTSHTEYAGRALTHERRTLVIDPRTGRRAVIVQPVFSDVYEQTEDEAVRVEFKEGKVSSIEVNQ